MLGKSGIYVKGSRKGRRLGSHGAVHLDKNSDSSSFYKVRGGQGW